MFDQSAERAGAYDFLENKAITPAMLASTMFEATASHFDAGETAYVIVDGTSLTLTDNSGKKGFGRIGSQNRKAQGIQFMNALAVKADGVPIGLIDQLAWVRGDYVAMKKNERTKHNHLRPFEDKECANFARAAKNAVERFAKRGVRVCIVIDREADNSDILFALGRLDCDFIVRSQHDRRQKRNAPKLSEVLAEEPILGRAEIQIGRTAQRAARAVTLDVRATRRVFEIKSEGWTREAGKLDLTVVSAKEADAEKNALDWRIFTNLAVSSFTEAQNILATYSKRWRIEEFHRTWKQGHINVEDALLQSLQALLKWATILAAVATRIDRLKYLARSKPDAPASLEFSREEIEALKRDQRSRGVTKKRVVPAMPTLAQVIIWIGELGSWVNQKGNDRPGSVTLGRGIERLSLLVQAARMRRLRRGSATRTT